MPSVVLRVQSRRDVDEDGRLMAPKDGPIAQPSKQFIQKTSGEAPFRSLSLLESLTHANVRCRSDDGAHGVDQV